MLVVTLRLKVTVWFSANNCCKMLPKEVETVTTVRERLVNNHDKDITKQDSIATKRRARCEI